MKFYQIDKNKICFNKHNDRAIHGNCFYKLIGHFKKVDVVFYNESYFNDFENFNDYNSLQELYTTFIRRGMVITNRESGKDHKPVKSAIEKLKKIKAERIYFGG